LYVAKPAGSAGLKAAQYTAKDVAQCTGHDRWSRFRHSCIAKACSDFRTDLRKACRSSRWP